MQQTIFDILYEKFKIDKPIRLIELFAGYGSQALALKYLGVNFEHWKICEWAVKSIQAYKDIHFTDIDIEFNSNRTKEEMVEFLYQKGISNNWNEPMTKEQIQRLSEQQLKTIIKNIAITHNLVNIQQVKGEDLEIVDTDKFTYLLTYSFPCQDLSLAGTRQLMSDTSTRSGMLWEVERILSELKEKPQVLLMENVPQVHGDGALQDFIKWQNRLEELGYKNYWQDLIATDYGIPQARNRCFMISILGDYNYTFPKPIPLKLKLKDLLEDQVDDKYYLSEKLIKTLSSDKQYGNYIRGEQFKTNINRDIAITITAASQPRPNANYIQIKNNNSKGYLEATEGDNCIGTYQYAKSDKFMQGKDRLQIGKEVSDTIQTQQKEAIVNSDLRIRKLTPRECFRLMGVKDEDINHILKNQSNNSLYHLAGDSIVVNVLMAIFKEMM